MRLRTILLVAGFAVCLVGGFLHDPHLAWGPLDKEIGASMILVIGLVMILVGTAMKPWPRVELNPETIILAVGLGATFVGMWLFDPRQGYTNGLSLFVEGNLGSLPILTTGVGLVAFWVSIEAGIQKKRLGLVVLLLCLLFAVILITRIPKRQAIDKGLEYFSDLGSIDLVGAWFGVERPRGMGSGFMTMSGLEPRVRLVWKIEIHHDSLFGCVWVAPWSGEIIAVDGPTKWVK